MKKGTQAGDGSKTIGLSELIQTDVLMFRQSIHCYCLKNLLLLDEKLSAVGYLVILVFCCAKKVYHMCIGHASFSRTLTSNFCINKSP